MPFAISHLCGSLLASCSANGVAQVLFPPLHHPSPRLKRHLHRLRSKRIPGRRQRRSLASPAHHHRLPQPVGREEPLPSRRLSGVELRLRQGLGAAGDKGGLPELQQIEPHQGAQGWRHRRRVASLGGVLLHKRCGGRLRGRRAAHRGGAVGAALPPWAFPCSSTGPVRGRVRGPRGGSDQWRCQLSGGAEGHRSGSSSGSRNPTALKSQRRDRDFFYSYRNM